MRPISNDLRLRIHEACQAGESSAEVAERFAVSSAFVRRLEQRFRLSGSLAPRAGRGGRPATLAGRDEELRRAVRDFPDATPAEHCDRLKLPVSRVTVWRALRRLQLPPQKKKTPPAPRGPPHRAGGPPGRAGAGAGGAPGEPGLFFENN